MENSVDCITVRQNSPDRDFGTKSSKTNQNLCIRPSHKKVIKNQSLSSPMKLRDLPSQNRPRERFIKHGAEALSDAERVE